MGGDGGGRGLVRRARVSLPHHLALRARLRHRLAPPEPATAGLPEAFSPSARLPASPDSPQAAHAAAVASLPSLDQEFLRRVNESILRHLADEAFGVDQPGAAIGTGRTQVHRKLKVRPGQSPGEGIRAMRLHRALALLRARTGTVAGVAYQVGYGSPAHFSTVFSRQFGYPPSAAARYAAAGEGSGNGE